MTEKIKLSSISLYYKILYLESKAELTSSSKEELGKTLGIGKNSLKSYLDPLLDRGWVVKDKSFTEGQVQVQFRLTSGDFLQLFECSHTPTIKLLIERMYTDRDILGKAGRLSPENSTILCLLLSRADRYGISEDLSRAEIKDQLYLTEAQLKSQLSKLRNLKLLRVAIPGRVFKNVIGRQNTIYRVNLFKLREILATGDAYDEVRHLTIMGEYPYAHRIRFKGSKSELLPKKPNMKREQLLGSRLSNDQIRAFQTLVDFRLTQYATMLIDTLLCDVSTISEITTDEELFFVDTTAVAERVDKDFPRTFSKLGAPKESRSDDTKSTPIANLKPVKHSGQSNQELPTDIEYLDEQLKHFQNELVRLSQKLARIAILKLQQLAFKTEASDDIEVRPGVIALSGDYDINVLPSRR
ncbi:MAG: hypothetical protein VYD07_07690 [Pseudomonadota bacterium]|nr:hypothetical protein [Pseudomonadota bacterium]